MSQEHHQAFIQHLEGLAQRDAGAMAALRRSLAFDPGEFPKAFPYVERYVPNDMHGRHPLRQAMYAVAGLYALHAQSSSRRLPAAFGQLVRNEGRPSLELRFVAMLDADPEGIVTHLRQMVSLLKAAGLAYDHEALLGDLRWLLDDQIGSEPRDRVRRDWARQFYGTVQADHLNDQTAAASAEQ